MSDDVDEEPEELPPDEPTKRRHVEWKKMRIGGSAGLTALGLFAGACLGLRMFRWAVCDGTWLCTARTKIVTIGAPATVTPTTTPAAPAPTTIPARTTQAPPAEIPVEPAPVPTTIAVPKLTGGWCDSVYKAYAAGRSITSNERKGCGL